MKKFMITGGLLGFLIGLISAWAQQADWPALIWRAAVGAVVVGLLMRWWGGLWARSLEEIYRQRRACDAEGSSSTPVSLAAKT